MKFIVRQEEGITYIFLTSGDMEDPNSNFIIHEECELELISDYDFGYIQDFFDNVNARIS